VPKRVTYVIDRRGIIRLAAHHELRMQRHVGEVQEMLRQIQEE
jgi:peroxiredoxin